MEPKLTKFYVEIMPWSSNCTTPKNILDIAIMHNNGKIVIRFYPNLPADTALIQLTENNFLALSMINNVADFEPWMIEESWKLWRCLKKNS